LAKAGSRKRWRSGRPCWLAIRGVRLHCIGRLQSNKAPEAVKLFERYPFGRPDVAARCAGQGSGKGRRFPTVYVQVNIGRKNRRAAARSRGGELVRRVRASPLPLAGLMAIPRWRRAGPFFALLAKLARDNGDRAQHGDVRRLSAAVMLGATAVRIGTALFED
jgi:uncharacterized pyridoxal phosphate-containing UPF0001 family protein